MMKKMLLAVFVFLIIFIPKNVNAITLGEYESKVEKYKKEISDTQSKIKLTEDQIAGTNNQIESIKKENQKLEEEIHNLNEEIENGKKEIKEKSLETKEYFAYLQVSNGENAYLEYAFGAETITDFIYRMSIVEQMTEYNEEIIDSLEEMIDRNNKRQEEIVKKEKELANKKKELEAKLVSLGESKSSLELGGIDSKKQLQIYQEIVDSYKKQGCKSNDVIGVDCAKTGSAGVFRRPTTKGYITSEFGARWGSVHRAVDITSPNLKSEKIYPVANGTITAKFTDGNGAICLMIEHYDNASGKWYTSFYAHMSGYAPNLYVGKYVTSDQYIGYMGNTGYVVPAPTKSNPNAGTHLHIEVTPCRIYKDSTCLTWSKYVNYVSQLIKQGYKGPRAMINFPASGVMWYSR